MQIWYELSECLSEAWWTIDIFKGWAVEKNTINNYENTFGIWIGPCIFLRVFHSHSHTYFVIVTVYTRIKIWPTNFSCTHQMETVIWRMSQSRRKTLHGNALLETLPTTRSLWDCHFSSWPGLADSESDKCKLWCQLSLSSDRRPVLNRSRNDEQIRNLILCLSAF